MNRNRYVYDVFDEKPVLLINRDIDISRAYFEQIALAFFHFRQSIDWQPQTSDINQSIRFSEDISSLVNRCIQELRYIFRSYYELWILRHILRIIVYATLHIDFDIAYARQTAK